MQTVSRVSGMPVTPLLIRYGVITRKLRRGEGLRQVQAFAGHKQISTTEDYRESGLEELRRAVDRFHPLGDTKPIE